MLISYLVLGQEIYYMILFNQIRIPVIKLTEIYRQAKSSKIRTHIILIMEY